MRLDKYLGKSFIGTRKKVHMLIAEGRITVNGICVKDATIIVDEKSDDVCFDGKKVTYAGKVCYMFNKPKGCICARSDLDKKTVLSYFDEVDTEGLFIVGRLDRDTEGLLLLTNDGELDHKLMSPKAHVEKKYFFWAIGEISEEDILRLESGLYLHKKGIVDGKITAKAKFTLDKKGCFKEYEQELKSLAGNEYRSDKCKSIPVFSGYLTISEGRKHQVKRMLSEVGGKVIYLKRVSIGDIYLDEKLKPGEYKKIEVKC